MACWTIAPGIGAVKNTDPDNRTIDATEFGLIECIRAATSQASASGVVIGIGDDAAVLQPEPGLQLLACTDTLVAAVHFPEDTPADAIGYKALAVNLSDLAAMGARPRWATVALTLPTGERAWVQSFASGLMQAAEPWGVSIVGGDTCAGPLTISIHLLGEAPPRASLLRSGARAGDLLAVTGTLGDAALALSIYQQQGRDDVPQELLQRLERPMARVDAGLALRGLASACIDISDGLLADAGHLAAASAVEMVIELEKLPVSPLFASLVDQQQRAALAMGGGDDYELCFTFAPQDEARIGRQLEAAGQSWQLIGSVKSGNGVTVIDPEGQPVSLNRNGYRHFHD